RMTREGHMPRYIARPVAIIAIAVALAACAHSPEGARESRSVSPDPRGGEGWRDLQTLSAWRGYKSQTVPTGWSERDGTIVKTGDAADLVSRDQYSNFELVLDWKLAPGGNSGVFYRATEEY